MLVSNSHDWLDMTNLLEKLHQDLEIFIQMAAEMPDYLKSDVLFWHMMKGDMPRLTLGGYLMRQHRLVALREQLTSEEQAQLHTAMEQFDQVIDGWVVRVEQRIYQEIEARLRQWREYLRDLLGENADTAMASYSTAVEARLMLTHLMDHLALPAYRTNEQYNQELELLDKRFNNIRSHGVFIWDGWQPAYPQEKYWYLYRG